jgi:hypothetical protein
MVSQGFITPFGQDPDPVSLGKVLTLMTGLFMEMTVDRRQPTADNDLLKFAFWGQ